MDELGIGIDDLRQDAEAMAAMRRNERELTDLRNAGLVAVEAVRAAEAKLHEAQNTMRPPVIEQAHAAVIAAEERRLELDKRAAALRTEHLLLRHKAARALDGREWAGDDAALGSVPLASPSSIANSRREEF
ncbi:MAG TPA: hypothetical protein VH370_13745 [Humisphaera sp.]|jgi:hypothetical protein|nr:hypothetical protein [Humisphaera sp.]